MPFALSARFGLGIKTPYHNTLFKTMTPDTFVSPTFIAKGFTYCAKKLFFRMVKPIDICRRRGRIEPQRRPIATYFVLIGR